MEIFHSGLTLVPKSAKNAKGAQKYPKLTKNCEKIKKFHRFWSIGGISVTFQVIVIEFIQ